MRRLLRKLLGLVFHPLVLTFLGLVLLSLLIYFIGPNIEIYDFQPLGDPYRWWLIAALFVVWIGNLCRRALLAWYRDHRMQAELRARPKENTREADSRAEVAEMAGRFDEALGDLRRHLKVRFGRRYLYQLPWYILIGPPASGKTTALGTLKNDELSFFRKVGGTEISGTRNCDWFFTSEAVLIDTAGRLVTQDSDREIDRAGWQGFLSLLKKFRRRRPINGVLVAMSAPDLLGPERRQSELAHAIKTRLQELHDEMGMRFPVYVLITKCDLLAGFNEFFDRLDPRERTQVWGLTLPLDENLRRSQEELLGQMERGYQGLRERLGERLLARLQDERNNTRRDRIFGFPQQFEGLYAPLRGFLREISQPNMLGEVPLLRGVYFTSGIQHGQPIDQLIYSLGQVFELNTPPPAESRGEKSYFVARLLRDVVFREAGIANTNLRWERHRMALQAGAYALTLLVAGLLTAGWLYSYRNNQALIEAIRAETPTLASQVAQVEPGMLKVSAVAPVLDSAQTLPAGYRERQVRSFLDHGLGLSQLSQLSDQGTLPVYRRMLRQGFAPRLRLLLEDLLTRGEGSGNADLFTTFQTYLILTGESPTLDRELVKRWWEQAANDAQWRALGEQHLDPFLDALTDPGNDGISMPPDRPLIRAVRARLLTRYPPDELIYRKLREDPGNSDIPPVDLGDQLGRDVSLLDLDYGAEGGLILNTEVPGWFSQQAIPDHIPGPMDILAQVDELWYLFEDEADTLVSAETLVEQVRTRYLEEYIQQWQTILDNVRIRPLPAGDFAGGASLLHRLGQPDSSLDRLFQEVDRQTRLTVALPEPDPGPAGSLLARLQRRFTRNRMVKRLMEMVDEASGGSDQENLQALVDRTVHRHFRNLHQMVEGEADAALLRAMEGLGDALDVYAANPSDQARENVEKAARQLARQADSLPPTVQTLVGPIVADAGASVDVGEQARLKALFNEAWRDELWSFCQRAIANRYPLRPGELEEISIPDFEDFFGAGSGMDQFFQQYLAEYVDRSGHPWRWDSRSGIEPAISAEALRQFELANTIKQRFFRGGGKLALNFRLRADSLGPGANSALLAVGGQELSYAHGPIGARFHPMAWPDPERIEQVRLVVEPRMGIPLSLRHEGPWALFRLLEEADVGKLGQETYRLRYSLGNEEVVYVLEPDSALHPFDLLLSDNGLGRFRCPDRL